MTAFSDTLLPASWRGVPFHGLSGELRFGRRPVVHEYPFRDSVWVEDLGPRDAHDPATRPADRR